MSSQAATKLMTAEEFAAFDGDEAKQYELIRGELVEMPSPGTRHAKLQAKIIRRMGNFVEEHSLGEVIGESGYKLESFPDTVRAPDVAFLTAERAAEADDPKFLLDAPDIAIEINSPNDLVSEVLDKTRWWLRQGCKQVWVVDDKSRTVTIYLPDGTARIDGDGDTLTAENLLPGFSLALADLFA